MTSDFEQISLKPGFMKHNGGLLFKTISENKYEFKTIIKEKSLELQVQEAYKEGIEALNAGDYKTASEEGLDSKWAKQVYNRAKRLMNRLRDIDVTDK